jgi:hypothetical protein
MPLRTLAILRTQRSLGSLLPDTIVHPQMLEGQVRGQDHYLAIFSCRLCLIFPVRVWDTAGEDQTLKGEYKVISGRMYVIEQATMLITDTDYI